MGYNTPHETVAATSYDVIIVGSGFAGANMAYVLGSQPYNRKVLIIEAGPGLERSREDYMENFFLNTFKSPSSPYPPNNNATFLDVPPEKVNAPRPTIQDLVKSEMCWIICLDAAPPRWVSRGRFVPRILRSVRL